MFGRKFGIVAQLWDFMKVNKKFWLLPLFLILLSFGIILVVAEGSVFAPFIYTIF